MRVLAGGLLGLFCAAAIAAGDKPARTLASPPPELARAALGDLRGSISVGVWRDGKANFAGDSAALFEIGSISKVFTGVLLAQAVERGDLSLDDTLGKLLAGKVASFTSDKVAAVTLRQLVTHTSCMPRLPADFQGRSDKADPYRNYDRARLWKAVASMTFDATPPCAASYSNLGVGLLGELLSERYGQPWETLVRERITGPLGMHDTVVTLGDKAPRLAPAFVGGRPTPPWEMAAFVGAGGLRSTAADMLLFGRALLAGRDGLLGAAAERVATPLARFDGDIGYAILVRGADLTARRSDEPVPPYAVQAEAELRRYVGHYALRSAMTFGVQMRDGQLSAKLGDQPRMAIFAVAGQADRFAYDVVKAELQFERDADGAARRVVARR